MADHVTACHPQTVPIYAFTNDSSTRRRLMLNRHLVSHRTAFSQDPEKTLQTAFRALRGREGFEAEDRVVVLSDVLAGQGVDAIQVRRLDS